MRVQRRPSLRWGQRDFSNMVKTWPAYSHRLSRLSNRTASTKMAITAHTAATHKLKNMMGALLEQAPEASLQSTARSLAVKVTFIQDGRNGHPFASFSELASRLG